MPHQANIYNQAKAIVFSILNKSGITSAYKKLDEFYNSMPITSWYGLKAELDFYIKNKDIYTLDPIFDFGIKCDFVGNIDGINNCRFDVTTNIEFKKLETYDPIQRQDKRKYKIVVMDKDNGSIIEIFDLNFPPDTSGDGRLLDVALFMPSTVTEEGFKYDFYQQIVSIGSSSPDTDFSLKCISTDWYLEDFEHLNSIILNELHNNNYNKEIESHAIMGANVLSKSTNCNIVACGQRFYYKAKGKDIEGDWVTKIYWKHPVIENFLDDIIWEDIAHSI